MKGLNARWTSSVAHNPSERNKVYQTIVGGRGFRNLLVEILENLQKETQKEQDRLPNYEDAAWAYRQAHLNGQKEMLNQVLEILPTEEDLNKITKTLTETN